MQNDLNYGRRPKLRWNNVVNVDLTKKGILITMITDNQNEETALTQEEKTQLSAIGRSTNDPWFLKNY